MMDDPIFVRAFRAIESLFLLPATPSSRLFWAFILSSVCLALLVGALRFRKHKLGGQMNAEIDAGVMTLHGDLENPPRGGFWSYFASVELRGASYWFNRSTLVDAGLMVLNGLLKLLLLAPILGTHLAGALAVNRFLYHQLGEAPAVALPVLVIGGVYTVVFFVVEDASRFALHWAMHKNQWLWRFHRIHHSARTLTPLTLLRVHPMEMTLYFLRGWLIFSLVSGVFLYLFPGQLNAWHILGVDIFGFLFNLMGANLRHSPIRLGFGAWERWFISPTQHQIHHSSARDHKDKNFGSCFALWDRLCGTHVASLSQKEPLMFGLSATGSAQEKQVDKDAATVPYFSRKYFRR